MQRSHSAEISSVFNGTSLRQVVVVLAIGGTAAKALLRSRNRRLYLHFRSVINAALAVTTCRWAWNRQVVLTLRPDSASHRST